MSDKKLPKGSSEVIRVLENNGGLTQIQLINEFKERNPRSIRYTIRTLLKKDLLIERPNFEDMRSSLIYINNKMCEFIFNVAQTAEAKHS